MASGNSLNMFGTTRRFGIAGYSLCQLASNIEKASAKGLASWKATLENPLTKTNPFYDKYAEKIERVKHENPEKFREKAPADTSKLDSAAGNSMTESKPSLNEAAQTMSGSVTFTKRKTLDTIVKLDHIANKTSAEISYIWLEYHKNVSDNILSAVVLTELYGKIRELSTDCPVFVYCLPRSDGFEFFLAQFSNDECYFTPLISYHAHKEEAPPCLSLTHYTDLSLDKDIVLLRGEFDKQIINAAEAQCLVNQLQLYYGQSNAECVNLVKKFNHSPDQFDHMTLVQRLDNVGNMLNSK